MQPAAFVLLTFLICALDADSDFIFRDLAIGEKSWFRDINTPVMQCFLNKCVTPPPPQIPHVFNKIFSDPVECSKTSDDWVLKFSCSPSTTTLEADPKWVFKVNGSFYYIPQERNEMIFGADKFCRRLGFALATFENNSDVLDLIWKCNSIRPEN
ncbi:uncharacterized protein LOC135935758 [Cloeon dipterum]|uniref:uncharacterized protein LOC135935758 n=1 Tax=Cloeon dipterum TaxID=197152 RepID=UPI00321FED7E